MAPKNRKGGEEAVFTGGEPYGDGRIAIGERLIEMGKSE